MPAEQTEHLADLLASLPPPALTVLMQDWLLWARDDQLPPQGDWRQWLMLGGRGAGKTRAGAEWVRGLCLGLPPFASAPMGRIALVGENAADVRDVMVEGVSGLLGVHGTAERPVWTPSTRKLVWPNGAVAQVFSSEDPESLRGPQFEAAWCDEIGKWRHARETWDMLQFGLRLGQAPRVLATTTPRPTPLLKALLADPATVVTRATTRDNAYNLAPGFVGAVTRAYGGTRLGRQELDGEMVDERADALWSRALIDAHRVRTAPDLVRVVVAVDPPATSGRRADACGLVVAGIDSAGIMHVLADDTRSAIKPLDWAHAALALYARHAADALVVEVNQGGEMATTILREVDASAHVVPVRATRGKYLRAEPIAALYQAGRVRHVGAFPALEDEMCDFGFGGLTSGRSPDRLDALVWALTHLADRPGHAPRIRGL